MIRLVVAPLGGIVGGAMPLALETSLGLSVEAQIAVSAITGTLGAVAAAYAFAMPRRECKATHHHVNGKIQSAALEARVAREAASALAREVSEMRGELKGLVDLVERIDRKLDERSNAARE